MRGRGRTGRRCLRGTHVPPHGLGVWCGRVTHEEVRARLAPYAAGTLAPADVEAVRAHLAGGCLACLGEVFERPVGLPRPGSEAPVVRRRSRRALVLGGMAAGGVLGGAATLWAVSELGTRRPVAAAPDVADAEHLAAEAAARGRLAARVEQLEGQVAAAWAAANDAGLARAGDDAARAALEQQLADLSARFDALTGELEERDRTLARLRTRARNESAAQVFARPGLQVLPLTPVGIFRDVRGHAVWHSGRASVVVYLFDLPTLAAGDRYRLRLVLRGGGTIEGPRVAPGRNGRASVTVALNDDPARLEEIQVVRESSGAAVLAGRTGPRAR